MLKSLNSRFEYVYNDDNYLTTKLTNCQFKGTFFEQAKTDSVLQALLTICEFTQRSQDCIHFSDDYNKQQPELQPMDTDDSTDHQQSTSSGKGFSIWDSYKKAMKKLGNPLQ